MDKEISLVFYRKGLRSFIGVDLCAECPRQDNKGCCGFYSPVFYPTDIHFIHREQPELLDYIRSRPRLTILDASVTVDRLPDGGGGFRCQFHNTQGGCYLPMQLRESICRHFVCPGINWEEEPALAIWKKYYDYLTDYEIALNNQVAEELAARGLSMRNPGDWDAILPLIHALIDSSGDCDRDWRDRLGEMESFTLRRRLSFGTDWRL